MCSEIKNARMRAVKLAVAAAAFALGGLAGVSAVVEGDIVGRLQPEGEVAKMGLPLSGRAEVKIESARLVDIRGRDPADLAFACELRVTRHDGVTGKDSLRFVCNGHIYLSDSEGKRVLELGSPVQKGVSDVARVAGAWMPVSFSLEGMAAGSGRISNVYAFDFNDIPKKSDAQTGVTYEIRNARILDVRAVRAWEAELAKATKAVENPQPLTTCNPLDLEYMIEPSRRRDNGTFTDVYIISGYQATDASRSVRSGYSAKAVARSQMRWT